MTPEYMIIQRVKALEAHQQLLVRVFPAHLDLYVEVAVARVVLLTLLDSTDPTAQRVLDEADATINRADRALHPHNYPRPVQGGHSKETSNGQI